MNSNVGDVAARLDRLPLTRGLWRLVILISLGGAFEFYDLFMTAYVAPGLVASGLFTARPAGFFAIDGVGFFVFCTFAGMWLGAIGFGFGLVLYARTRVVALKSAETTTVSPAFACAISSNPTYAVNPGIPRTPSA